MTDTFPLADQASLVETEATLSRMHDRLDAISRSEVIDEQEFVEIAAILDNVSYIFLYLESNSAFVDAGWLLPWFARFHGNEALDQQLLSKITSLVCKDPEVEDARSTYERYFKKKILKEVEGTGDDGPAAKAKLCLQDLESDQAALVARLQATTKPKGRAAAVFYNILSSTESDVTRVKLARAWRNTRRKHDPALIRCIDEMIVSRRNNLNSGEASVLSRTLRRCKVEEAQAEIFLNENVRLSVASHQALEREIRHNISSNGLPLDHFGYYLKGVQRGAQIPTLELNACLDFICSVASRVFGLEFILHPGCSRHVLQMDVCGNGRFLGRVNFDLWDDEGSRVANYTNGARNRTEWGSIKQFPIAYVSCRFRRDTGGGQRITFQNVHSLFHEFGHALNHLLIKKRLPNLSGLEYLPLERIENLSMWFEKWVYHPEFRVAVSLSAGGVEALTLCQHIKKLEYRRTHLERAVTAAIDFAVHASKSESLQDAFERLDRRFGISDYCELGEFLPSFTWPMLRANPGAYFAYLWGASDSAAKFTPFLGMRIGELSSKIETALFDDCFDPDAASEMPDPNSVFEFYDNPNSTQKGFTRGSS